MHNILNLYAGLGGNRDKWYNCQVTAVENDPEVAKIYKQRYPKDIVIIGDAHQYLLNNYKKYEFIWSSPPCQTHSRTRFAKYNQDLPVYPDMTLYQEIIFLNKYAINAKFIVENVIPYYTPLIRANCQIGRHNFWTNINITPYNDKNKFVLKDANVKDLEAHNNIDLKAYKGKKRKMQVLRNMVISDLGLHIYENYLNEIEKKHLKNKYFEINNVSLF